MKALVYRGPGDLRLEDRPDPKPRPREAVLRVQACGICGTDLRIESGDHQAFADGVGRIPGHEIAGVVVEAGSESGLQEGVRVFVAPNIGCGRCRACRSGNVNICNRPQALGITRNGAMSDLLLLESDLIEKGNVLPIPNGHDPGAIALVEPIACVLRGSRAVAIQEGDVVLISGAGPIGLLHLKVAQLQNPSVVIVSEPSPERRRQAKVWGADHVVDPLEIEQRLTELSPNWGADAIVVAAPSKKAQEQSVQLAAPRARINFFGGLPSADSLINLDTNRVHYKELVVTGTSASTTADCREALGLVLSGKIDPAPVISQRFPLTESNLAFAAARSGESLKVVLEP